MNPNGNLNAKVSKLLVVVIVLQGLTLAGQWLGGGASNSSAPGMLPSAQAQFANAGADRQAMVDELKQTNSKLDKIYTALTGGNIQVKAVLPDDQKGGNAGNKNAGAANTSGNGSGSGNGTASVTRAH
jgi:hypothetical protein